MKGTVAPPSRRSMAAWTCASRTASSVAMMEAMFCTAGLSGLRSFGNRGGQTGLAGKLDMSASGRAQPARAGLWETEKTAQSSVVSRFHDSCTRRTRPLTHRRAESEAGSERMFGDLESFDNATRRHVAIPAPSRGRRRRVGHAHDGVSGLDPPAGAFCFPCRRPHLQARWAETAGDAAEGQ